VNERFLPVSAPDLTGNEERYVVDALRSSWISSTGPYVKRFEAEFAERCGTRTAISVANGTVALHLALAALGVSSGDEVIVPSLTYIATANAVRYVSAEPVFVDVDPATWCIDPAAIDAAITPRTKGIIVVHLYGHPADMDAVNEVAERHGLWVVEDAAEAHGAHYRGRPTGSLGTMATFSFYGNKIVTSGEGGALTLNDPELERRLRLLRGQGMDPERRYYFIEVGYNYRLTNLASALLCAQLERLDQILAARRKIFNLYRDALADIPGIGFQPVALWADPAPWMFCATVDEQAYGITRDELMALLLRSGVETRPFFVALHKLPPYAGRSGTRFPLPNTERLSRQGINLPTFVGLTATDVERISALVRSRAATHPR
jgi:perosamine synthetase